MMENKLILESHRDIKSENPTPPTRIVCAANKMPDGRILCGVRHCDEIMWGQNNQQSMRSGIQGFIDNRGNFLTREEAYEMAHKFGQLYERKPSGAHFNPPKLFSEDLY